MTFLYYYFHIIIRILFLCFHYYIDIIQLDSCVCFAIKRAAKSKLAVLSLLGFVVRKGEGE